MKSQKNLTSYIFNTTSLFLFFLFFSLSQSSSSQQLAFPSAKGAAAYVSGGRGGSVSVVTNLNDSGPGSLRSFASVSNTTIVFNVSGIIKLSNLLRFTGNNVTIAGQTAPEGGITIEGRIVIFQNNENLIVRYLRFRNGYHNRDIDDSITSYGLIDVIFDHCSISFGGDEAIELVVDNSRDQGGAITVQNCFIAESKTGSIMGAQAASAPDVFGTLSMIGNVWYNITHRFPNIVGNARIDLINNYVHNSLFRLTRGNGGYTLNQLGNLYDFGNNTVWDETLNHHGCETWYDLPSIYAKGNTIIGNQGNGGSQPVSSSIPEMNANNRLMWKYFYDGDTACGFGTKNKGDQLEPAFFSNTQHALLGLAPTIHRATELKNIIVPTVGANKRLNPDGTLSDNTDDLDAEWKRNIMEGNYVPKMDQSKYATPAITSVMRPRDYDSDNDGMPDEWEMMMFNTLSHDGTKDSNGNGYTDLEDFLNQVDLHEAKNVEVERIDVSPSTARLQLKETLQLSSTYTPRNTTNKNGTWSSSNTAIATVDEKGLVTPVSVGDGPVSVGEVEITYISSDGHTKGTSRINVVVPPVLVYAGIDQEICNGGSTTFTATGASSYLWNTGSRGASITVAPSTSRTYTVTGYDRTGRFSDTDEVRITVASRAAVDAGNNVTIYSGESTILNATGATTYKWNTGDTTAKITVSPSATTTYTVSGTTNGCGESTDTVTVTVVDRVGVVANAGRDQSICLNTSATLTATGGSTYLWNTGDTTASITVTPNQTTTYTVTAYDRTGNNSDTDDVVVTVNSLPEVDAGSDVTINSGETVTLTAKGADSYRWNNGEVTASINVSPSTTTTYTVTGKINDCEVSDSVTVFSIEASVKANAGQDVDICLGTTVTLTATGGASYLWSTGDKTESIEVSPNETNTYSVTVFDGSGTNFDTDEVTVTVNPLPIVDAGKDRTIDSGESVTLTGTGATSYKWSTGETSASITVSPTATKTYTVTGTTNGCEVKDTVTVTVLNSVEVIADAGADQSICSGTDATLTATGGSTYLWNTGATTASINVKPTATTTYSVTAYDNTGKFSDKDEVTVTVNALPIVDAGKNITINSGQSTKLTATGANSYEWSTGATSASITVSPKVTQTYTVTGMRNGCEVTDKVKVTVVEPEVVVARAGGNQDVCEGGEVTLTATGGERYLWSTGAKTASIKVNPKVTTKYSVTAYVGNSSGTDEVIVKVSPKPNVSIINGSEATILEGEFITLSAKGAEKYKWSNGATQPNIAVRPTKTKTYDVVGYVNDCSSEKSIRINVFEKVVASAGDDLTICSEQSTVLTASGPANSDFLWSTGETTKSITVSPDEDTEYSVMVYHDLDSDTDSVMVKVQNCVNSQIGKDNEVIEDTASLEFLIHPNPTYGEVHIKISGVSNASSIHLYDLSGKSLYKEAISVDDNSYNKTIDLSEFASGIYLLQLVDNQKVITKKIVLR